MKSRSLQKMRLVMKYSHPAEQQRRRSFYPVDWNVSLPPLDSSSLYCYLTMNVFSHGRQPFALASLRSIFSSDWLHGGRRRRRQVLPRGTSATVQSLPRISSTLSLRRPYSVLVDPSTEGRKTGSHLVREVEKRLGFQKCFLLRLRPAKER